MLESDTRKELRPLLKNQLCDEIVMKDKKDAMEEAKSSHKQQELASIDSDLETKTTNNSR